MTTVSNIRIIRVKPKKNNDKLVALATCVLDNKYFVGSIGIFDNGNGDFIITYPTKKFGNSSLNLFLPNNPEDSEIIRSAIVDEFTNLISI